MKLNWLWLGVFSIFLMLVPDSFGQGSGTDSQKVESMNSQFFALNHQGKCVEAFALALKALKYSEDTLGPNSAETAVCLNDLGGMYQLLGDYTNAETMFKRGLEIREKVLGPEHQYTARNLDNLGSVYVQMGRYADAEPLLERALAINEKVLGEESHATMISLGELSNLYLDTGDYPKAEAYEERAMKIAEEIEPKSPDVATGLQSLAAIDLYMGDYAKAEPLLLKALDLSEKELGPQHPNTGGVMEALGVLYDEMGDFARSESYFQRALSVQEIDPGPNHPDTAITLESFGFHYMNMGDYDKALSYCTRALTIQEKRLGPDDPEVAKTLGKLGAIYENTHNFAQAAALDEKVLSIDEKALGLEKPATAIALMNLGGLCLKMGETNKAESYAEQALAIEEKVQGTNSPDLAAAYNNLASVYFKMGEPAKAEPMYIQALSIDVNVFGTYSPAVATHLGNLATTYFDLQRTNDALEFADQAEEANLDILDDILSFTSEQQRLDYEAQNDPYILFASLNDANRTALTILRHKGVVLDSLLEDRLVAKAGHDPANQALIDRLVSAKQQLAQLSMAPKDLDPETLENRTEQRDKLGQQVEQLEGDLAENVAGLGNARRALTVTVEQVQKAIPPHAALVEFILYSQYLGHQQWEKRYGAAILTPSGKPKWVCLGAAGDVEKSVLLYQHTVRDTQKKDSVTLAIALHKLYKEVWGPLDTQLPSDTKTVIVSPDASLNFVSFATLLTQDNRFLAEKYSIRYVASGRDLLDNPVPSTNQDMVIFAAPNYLAGNHDDVPPDGLHLQPLPYFAKNADELETMAKVWGWPVQVYSGDAATEAQVRRIHSPHILQFSTHGFFLPKTIGGPDRYSFSTFETDSQGYQQPVVLKNPMYRSGIALAGAEVTLDAWERGETPPTDDDGILMADEVGSLDLNGTWLVVLTACDTGIGQRRDGEGVMGLRRGFVQAGAQNLLMTLWPVFDVPSGKMMSEFYSTLHEDNNPPEALAEVQRFWLVKLRSEYGLFSAVGTAGPFIMSSRGPVRSSD